MREVDAQNTFVVLKKLSQSINTVSTYIYNWLLLSIQLAAPGLGGKGLPGEQGLQWVTDMEVLDSFAKSKFPHQFTPSFSLAALVKNPEEQIKVKWEVFQKSNAHSSAVSQELDGWGSQVWQHNVGRET